MHQCQKRSRNIVSSFEIVLLPVPWLPMKIVSFLISIFIYGIGPKFLISIVSLIIIQLFQRVKDNQMSMVMNTNSKYFNTYSCRKDCSWWCLGDRLLLWRGWHRHNNECRIRGGGRRGDLRVWVPEDGILTNGHVRSCRTCCLVHNSQSQGCRVSRRGSTHIGSGWGMPLQIGFH